MSPEDTPTEAQYVVLRRAVDTGEVACWVPATWKALVRRGWIEPSNYPTPPSITGAGRKAVDRYEHKRRARQLAHSLREHP